MPYTTTIAIPTILEGLTSVVEIGSGAIKLASGVAFGIEQWISTLVVTTVDTGSVGTGVGAIPLVIPNPLLFSGLSFGFVSNQIMGVWAPQTITGLTIGIVNALLPAIVTTTHPSVGVGSAVCKFSAGSAVPGMISGFQSQGMNTPVSVKMATAVARGLDSALAALVLISPIIGTPSPSATSGVGFGKIL